MEKDLEAKIKALEMENQDLRRRLSQYEPIELNNIQFTTDEKLNIFMNYFHGREDVVAIRFFHKAKNRYAYTPFCANEFQDGICLKKMRKFNCIECPNRDFIPYTRELLLEHFKSTSTHQLYKNKEIYLGIYPLLKDGTCSFLAIDFDDGNWLQEMICVKRIAQKYSIDAVMERSQSGAGGHLWMFFDQPILASKVRKLGRMLLKEAMRNETSMQLHSFDRMFPNQDILEKDGLGNLIALPLQYQSFQKGNSAFINEKEQVIDNQIAYLSTVKKINEQALDQILSQEEIEDYFFDGNQIMLSLGSDHKYSHQIEYTEDSMLHINKNTLNANTLNMIRRMSSMINPEYYLKMRLHKSIFQTPYILSEYIESEQTISIPRGCKEKLHSVFSNATIKEVDHTTYGNEISVSFKGELQNQQRIAIEECLRYPMGLLHAPAGFGKTVMAIYTVAKLKRSTLIIVPTKDLLKQWKERLDMFLDYPKTEKKKNAYIGEYSGSKKRLTGNIDIATIQSISKNEDLYHSLQQYGCIIIDECHHIPAMSFRKVLCHISAHYIYGFSATPQRQDGLEKIVYMFCGPKRYEVNKKLIIAQRKFRQFLIPHFTSVRLLEQKETYQEIIDILYTNEHRNFLIANDIITEYRHGRRCIVLSERIEHLQILYEKVRDVSPNVFVFRSDMKTVERSQQMKKIREIANNEKYIIIATSKLLGEGFDLSSLDTLFLTLPISDKNRIAQYTGRIHREFAEKSDVYVHDYVDVHIPMMDTMFQKRMKAYESEGYTTNVEEPVQEIVQYVYDLSTYFKVLSTDIKSARKHVVIAMRQYSIKRLKQYFALIQETNIRGVVVTFVIFKDHDIDQEALKVIKGTGSNIRLINKKIRMNMIVIDQKVIWYGELNLLGRNFQDNTIIRLENQMLIEEMLDELHDEV